MTRRPGQNQLHIVRGGGAGLAGWGAGRRGLTRWLSGLAFLLGGWVQVLGGSTAAELPRAPAAPTRLVATAPARWVQAIPMPAGGAADLTERVRACVACHGKEGRASPGGYLPRIAGKPAEYLYHQLLNFRSGARRNAAMQQMVAPLSDAYLHEMAAYFAGLEVPYPLPEPVDVPAAALARGRRLVQDGNPGAHVPACAACHGERLTGRLPAIPGLLGLPRDYLNAQLQGWRQGLRHAHNPDCMAQVATRLAPDDISAASAWLAAQPVPGDPHPAPADGKPLPLQCGSQVAMPVSAPPTWQAEAAMQSADPVARGAYLARAGNCASCHTRPGGGPYAGGRAIETPFGAVYTSNLTPDTTLGLGRWTADDFWRAMHEGRSRDGHALYPAFPYPYYTQLSRPDSDALFAWLRTLPSVSQATPANTLRFPYNSGLALWTWRQLYFRPGSFVPTSNRSAAWNRGAYLVRGAGHCGACHTPRDRLGGERSGLELAGGVVSGQAWYAPALHPDNVPGQPPVLDQQDIRLLLSGGVAQHQAGGGPMAEVIADGTAWLTDDDRAAITTYLASLEALAVPGSGKLQAGHRIYQRECETCHGPAGAGQAARYPALAGSRSVTLPRAVNSLQRVLNGGYAPATAVNPRPFGMPPYRQKLNNEEIAAVTTYIRQSWGNAAGDVSPDEVDALR